MCMHHNQSLQPLVQFAWSWGPLGWLVPSEIQPLETRSMGTSISTFIKYVV